MLLKELKIRAVATKVSLITLCSLFEPVNISINLYKPLESIK